LVQTLSRSTRLSRANLLIESFFGRRGDFHIDCSVYRCFGRKTNSQRTASKKLDRSVKIATSEVRLTPKNRPVPICLRSIRPMLGSWKLPAQISVGNDGKKGTTEKRDRSGLGEFSSERRQKGTGPVFWSWLDRVVCEMLLSGLQHTQLLQRPNEVRGDRFRTCSFSSLLAVADLSPFSSGPLAG
jgi:hypothetical protein